MNKKLLSKTSLVAAGFAALASPVIANLADYQSVITSQSPARHYTLDGTLGDTITADVANTLYEWGTNATSGFQTVKYTTDFWGNSGKAIGQDENGTGVPAISAGRLGIDPIALGLDMTSTGQNTMSWLTWMQHSDDPTGVRNIMAQGNSDPTRMGIREDDDPAGIQITAGGQGYTQWANFTTTRHPDGKWVYYAVSWDNNSEEINFYVGDIEAGTLTKYTRSMDDDSTPATNSFGFNDGSAANNSDEIKWLTSFGDSGDDTMMDELAVWNSVLSDADIQSQFDALAPPPLYKATVNSQGPVRYYTLDGTLADSITADVANTLYEWGTNATSSFQTVKYTTDFWGNAGRAIGQDENGAGVPAISPGRLGIDPIGLGLDMTSTGQNTMSWLTWMQHSDDPAGVRNIFAQGNSDPTRMGIREDDDPAGIQITAGGQGYTQWANFTDARHPDGKWVYYAVSWDNNSEEINFYVGDIEAGTLAKYTRSMDDDSTPATNSFGFNDGSAANNSDEIKWLTSFGDVGDDTMMDELAVWNSVLSDADIQAQFDALVFPVVPIGVGVVPSGSDIEVSIESLVGLRYQLQVSTDGMATWNPTGPIKAGTGSTLVFTDAGAAPSAGGKVFYRISVTD